MDKKLSNSELIDFVYFEIAAPEILARVPDFSNSANWKKIVNTLDLPIATVYRIGIFNQEVMNGGLLQYFDNGYGIFAYETLADLKRIGAESSYKILNEALKEINPSNFEEERFVKMIVDQEYEVYRELIESKIDDLDSQYYALEETEDLEKLLADYIRKNEI